MDLVDMAVGGMFPGLNRQYHLGSGSLLPRGAKCKSRARGFYVAESSDTRVNAMAFALVRSRDARPNRTGL
ncbi:hypothetical protein ACRALDRAFT_2037162 [Sodiomyces alcalophilus JCM 7366]|uniref:uncharacterized protein n=1 Tax=Sodiomyces alcalophilus JCM 7366 TaxID=591952 RepID=UPI0039B5073B